MNDILCIVMCLLKFLCALSCMKLEHAYADLLNSFACCEIFCIVFNRGCWEKEEKHVSSIATVHRAKGKWSSNESPYRLNIRTL